MPICTIIHYIKVDFSGGLCGLNSHVLKHGKSMLLKVKSYSIGETGVTSHDSVWICDI